MQTEKNEYAYAWHDAICQPCKSFTKVGILRKEPLSMVQQMVTFKICKNQDEIHEFLTTECKGRNVRSAREFLKTKPKIFAHIFMVSMGGAFLSVEFLLKFDIIIPGHQKNLSAKKADAILKLMDRWGLLWQFMPGEYCNLIESV